MKKSRETVAEQVARERETRELPGKPARTAKTAQGANVVTADLLRRMPLPEPDEDDDKDSRGRVLVVAGSAEMPGAAVLAGVAALRAGAGKVRVAAPADAAQTIAAGLPEARVYALPLGETGTWDLRAGVIISDLAREARAVLVGPGLLDDPVLLENLIELLREIKEPTLVIDAVLLKKYSGLSEEARPANGRVVLTPNRTELSEMTGEKIEAIRRDPARAARQAADGFGACVALKGRETFIASPRAAEVYSNRAGNVGLATSGSGDVLSGLIAGLAARGAEPLQAALWGVHAHALAGERLARRVGRIGYLARELLDEIPQVLDQLGS
ncbi:MAG: NAD(P)H-hydrate dehydratase [Acidobacteria bacterium]|nr:NAD(P)H-hydrate dehydratase [Acidobacteriota bacterium]MCA1640525.1 NAD(P)H-hydrate dehydratase [Acidobacteriota bacterium]